MKTTALLLLLSLSAAGQQEYEQQLELLAEKENIVTDDDAYLQQLDHPLNLNTATEEDLQALQLLTALQVYNFLQYRKLLGNLVHIYELQAIPGWNIATIKTILPYISIDPPAPQYKNGEHKLLLRTSDALNLTTRYTYKYKNLLQYGFTTDKDAHEKFFDFYSAHLFLCNRKKVKALALGDYTVRLGQGLIQWQGLAFRNTNIKRQSHILQPYNSPGEYNFYRGAGITLQQKKLEVTLFTSYRTFDGDTLSSINTTGYHRTASELANKNNIPCFTYGGALQWHSNQAQISLNTIHHPSYHNYSIDYGYTFRNMHFFGEIATDKNLHLAQLHGLIASLHATVDISILYRSIHRNYQSLFTNAFTQNTSPINENGLFAGLIIRPQPNIQIDCYADVFKFPWLKYRIDQPSQGQEYLAQLTYTPNKTAELYTRFRYITNSTSTPKKNWRTQIAYKLSRQLQLRTRMEAVWINTQTGFLFFQDIKYKPAFKPISITARLLYVETDSYDTRIYAMENLLQYNFSIPAFYGKGWRTTLSLNYHYKKNCLINMALAYEQKRTSANLQLILTRH